jgi:hypothetical protein
LFSSEIKKLKKIEQKDFLFTSTQNKKTIKKWVSLFFIKNEKKEACFETPHNRQIR